MKASLPKKHPCGTHLSVKIDWSVDHGKGANQAAAENEAKDKAESKGKEDGWEKKDHYPCKEPCEQWVRVRILEGPTIVGRPFRDSRGQWHATAQVKWALDIKCECNEQLVSLRQRSKRKEAGL